VDHRVEPPAWLPQGAAPEAVDPEAADSPAAPDAQQAEDNGAAPAEAAEEYTNGNGHDNSFTYSRDDSYHYGGDASFGEGTSYRSPFAPHTAASTSYEGEEPAAPENEVPGDQAAGDDLPQATPAGHDLPASGLSSEGMIADSPPGDALLAGDLPASGFDDPAMPSPVMPDPGFRDAPAGFRDAAATYTDTATSRYDDPGPLPYPAAEPLAATATAETGSPYDGASTAASDQRAAFSAGTTAVTAGIGAALRAGKQRSSARFSRGQEASRSRSSAQARKANLVISRVEPWSVMKFSFLISLVLWIVMFVAVALLYYALSSLGVFAAVQRTLASVTSSQTSAGVDLTKWTSASRVLGYTMLLGAVDVVLITAISTVGAVIYNLVTHLGGGIEVTLKETE
jgi:transmembrane protein DUF3566